MYRNPDVALETKVQSFLRKLWEKYNKSKSQKDPTIPWLKKWLTSVHIKIAIGLGIKLPSAKW